LEHGPDPKGCSRRKVERRFPCDKREAFTRGSCSNKNIRR
jgi:hypothetical protein